MLLGKSYANPENVAEAEWFVLPTGEKKKPTRFRVRRVPDGKDMELKVEHYGRRVAVRYRKGVAEEDVDLEARAAYWRAYAVFAFADAENAEWGIGDVGDAERWSKLLGRSVTPGEEIPINASIPREALDVIFQESEFLRDFVRVNALSLRVQLGEEKRALGKA